MSDRAAREASAFLIQSFQRGGGLSVNCICGRNHHGTEEEPVLWVEVAGTTAVEGCGCEWLWRLERMLWTERAAILNYYKARRESESNALAGLDDEQASAPA